MSFSRDTFSQLKIPVKVWIALIGLCLVWGSGYLAVGFAVQAIPPFLMTGLRHLTSGMLLISYCLVSHKSKPRFSEWRATAIVALFLVVGGAGLGAWGQQWIASGITATIMGVSPLMIVVLDVFLLRKYRLDRLTMIGVMVGFTGLCLLVGSYSPESTTQPGILLGWLGVGLSALAWSIGSILHRDLQIPSYSLLATGMEMLLGGATLTALSLSIGEWNSVNWSAIQLRSLLATIYLFLFPGLLGFSLYTWLLRETPVALVSTNAYVTPLIALILGSWLNHEIINLRIVASATAILGSVFLVWWSSRKAGIQPSSGQVQGGKLMSQPQSRKE